MKKKAVVKEQTVILTIEVTYFPKEDQFIIGLDVCPNADKIDIKSIVLDREAHSVVLTIQATYILKNGRERFDPDAFSGADKVEIKNRTVFEREG